ISILVDVDPAHPVDRLLDSRHSRLPLAVSRTAVEFQVVLASIASYARDLEPFNDCFVSPYLVHLGAFSKPPGSARCRLLMSNSRSKAGLHPAPIRTEPASPSGRGTA